MSADFLRAMPPTFVEQVRVEPSGCARWLGPFSDGSPRFRVAIGGKVRWLKARVVAWELSGHRRQRGQPLRCTCGNWAWCVSPQHMEVEALVEAS